MGIKEAISGFSPIKTIRGRRTERQEAEERRNIEERRLQSEGDIDKRVFRFAEEFLINKDLDESERPALSMRQAVAEFLKVRGEDRVSINEILFGVGHNFWSIEQKAKNLNDFLEGRREIKDLDEGFKEIFGRPGLMIHLLEVYENNPDLLRLILRHTTERIVKISESGEGEMEEEQRRLGYVVDFVKACLPQIREEKQKTSRSTPSHRHALIKRA